MKPNRGYRQARLGNPGRALALGFVIAGAFFSKSLNTSLAET